MRSVIGPTASQSASPAEPGPAGPAIPPASPAAAEYDAQAHASRPGTGDPFEVGGIPLSLEEQLVRGTPLVLQKGTVPSTSFTARLGACQAIWRPHPPSCPAQRSGARGPAH
jgi:hypothetical protein